MKRLIRYSILVVLASAMAACATSPHSPQPTQLSITVATGSLRNGSGEGFTVSDGQPERRMQE